MAHVIQLRGGTAAEGTTADPILNEREIGIEVDTNRLKIGDGVTPWNTLPYGIDSGKLDGEHGSFFRKRYTKIHTNNAYHSTIVEDEYGQMWGWGGTNHVSHSMFGLGLGYGTPPALLTGSLYDYGTPIQQSCHSQNTMWLYEDGDLYITGENISGIIGDGTTSTQLTPYRVDTGVTRYWGSQTHDYAYQYGRLIWEKSDGTYWGTGRYNNGEFGIGTASNATTPIQLSWIPSFGLKHVYHVGGYDGFCFFVMVDGTIMFAGDNGNGQGGYGTTAASVTTPVDVTANWGGSTLGAAGDVIDMKMTHNYNGSVVGTAIMLRADGTVRGAGYNAWSQLGQNNLTQQNTAVVIPVSDVVQIANPMGTVMTLYMRTSDNKIYRCGHNAQGQLGRGDKTTAAMFPYNSGDSNNIDNKCDMIFNANRGSEDTAYICSGVFLHDANSGVTWAAGDNGSGVLGTGDYTDVTIFKRMKTKLNFIDIKVNGYDDGGGFATGIDEHGRLWGWGYNGRYNIPSHSNRNTTSSFPWPTPLDVPYEGGLPNGQ